MGREEASSVKVLPPSPAKARSKGTNSQPCPVEEPRTDGGGHCFHPGSPWALDGGHALRDKGRKGEGAGRKESEGRREDRRKGVEEERGRER